VAASGEDDADVSQKMLNIQVRRHARAACCLGGVSVVGPACPACL
jgi:hypothetical protein